MTSPATIAYRATTWLCLAVAVLMALVPASGVTVCLGHDGHVGFGVGAAGNPCPCGHEAALDNEEHPRALDAARHPPCDDVALDTPEFVSGTDHGPQIAKPADDESGGGMPPLPCWPPSCAAPAAPVQDLLAWWAESASHRPRQQIEHRRTVVLLI